MAVSARTYETEDELFPELWDGAEDARDDEELFPELDEEPEEERRPARLSTEFNEEEHPRGDGGRFAEKSDPEHHVSSLESQRHGEKSHVGGFPVRRLNADTWRLETDRHHIEGPAHEVADRIAREWRDQRPDARRMDEALQRAEAWQEPDFFTEPDRVEEETRAFEALPRGTRVVSLEPETFGRLGSIVHKTEERDGKPRTVKAVKLDGSPEPVGNYVEPLDPRLSWRAERGEDQPVSPQFQQATLFATGKGKGQWITIGARQGEDGKRHGGSPVYVENGRIVKGHPGLTGKKIDALKEDAPDDRPEAPAQGANRQEVKAHQHKLAGLHRADLNRSADYSRATFAKQARREGIKPAGLHQLAAELIAHDRAFKADRTRMLKDARSMSVGMRFGDIRNLRQRAARGDLDSDAVKGFDVVAASMADQYPEQFPDPDQAPDRLFELLVEGNPEPMGEEDAYRQAMEHLRTVKASEDEERARAKVADDEPIPFALPVQFATPPDERVAEPAVEELLKHALAQYRPLAAKIRAELLAAVRDARGTVGSLQAARRILDRWRPIVGESLTEVHLASVLAGMRRVLSAESLATPAKGGAAEVSPDPSLTVPPPASLSPADATDLFERARLYPDTIPALVTRLPPEQADWLTRALASTPHLPPPLEPPFTRSTIPGGSEPPIRLPMVEHAVEDLRSRRLLTRADYDQLTDEARSQAFTVAGIETEATIGKVRDALAETVQQGPTLPDFERRVEEAVGEGTFLSEAHACFLPGTHVEGDVIAASRAWYSGPAVEIETNDGRKLAVTVNHPILTSNGWKHAGSIHQGDQLLCYGNPVELLDPFNQDLLTVDFSMPANARAIDNQDVPPTIEDVFQSLSIQRESAHCIGPVSPLDGPNSCLFQAGDKIVLMPWNNSASKSASHRSSLFDSFGLSSSDSTTAVLGVGERELDSFGFGNWVESSPVKSVRFGPSADLDASRFHATNKNPGGDVQLFRELVRAFPSQVAANRVVKIKRIAWTGHVYDLQTRTGFIVSQGLVTGNSNVYRTNVQALFAEGQDRIIAHPLVADAFPYVAYYATHDDRTRPEHLALEKMGLDGTNIYRADDPVILLFRPPWDFSCRCGRNFMTIRMAAEKGVKEAQRWLETGQPPERPEFVRMPDFRPPPGFGRGVVALSLARFSALGRAG